MCLCRMLTQSSSRRIVFSFQRKIFIFCCKTIQFLLLFFFADVETCTHTMIYQMFKCYVYSNPSLLCKRLHIKSILMLNIHLGGRDNICLFPLRKLVQTNYQLGLFSRTHQNFPPHSTYIGVSSLLITCDETKYQFQKERNGVGFGPKVCQKIFAPVEINILRVAIARLMVKVIIHGTRTELQIIMEFSDKNKHFLTLIFGMIYPKNKSKKCLFISVFRTLNTNH